ncbi:Ig-like domain-containing protein [Sphingomonas qilianensis]|uniref:Ig-like domain-containing protein n=1 Tax=Sphingomonas qilianensis TaxID=1736690 RepID=A0ABU9XSI4_9SPHN
MAYTNCETTIGPDEVLCSQTHCNNYQNTSSMKRVCYCLDWKGNKIPNCEVKGDSFPVSTTECYNKATGERRNITPTACDELRDRDKNWGNRTCFCCCSCFAWGTRLAVGPGQTREIQEVGIGETILTGSLASGTLEWTPRRVVFSDGTSPAADQIAIVVQYGDGGEIVVTTDQPFLMPDGTLKRADRLTVEDQLVDDSGTAVTINSVWLGKLDIGLHNIAADTGGDTLDGHLLSVNGIVAGDHTVRVLQSSDEYAAYFASGHDELPVIGSVEYATQGGEGTTQFASVARDVQTAFRDGFVAMAEVANAPVPKGAAAFVTPAQATDIRKNGSFRPLGQATNKAEFEYLRKVFSAFYPDIYFRLNWEDQTPNLFAYTENGMKLVYVSGALLRATCVGRDGLAFLMAHGVGRLIGAPPGGARGVACTGQADYFGIGYVFIDVLYGRSSEAGLAALKEIGTLFGFISAENAAGTDRCMNPSIACRLDALNAALAGQELPYCAGAPSIGTLALETAEYIAFEGVPTVVATFSEAVYPGSTNNVVNFQIRPVAGVLVAGARLDRPEQVILNVVLPDPPAGTYTLSVSDVLSMEGSTLDPARSSATFTVA